ncbi:MAG: response regulator [Planctomycetes bacterium]|nr:response regulator [Planctomycetota bacterium]
MKDRICVRVLVIDDDRAVCRQLHGWLEAAAYDVSTFTEASAGLQYAARVPCQLALVDLRLPDADGSETIEALLRICADTRVIAMSAFPDGQQVIAAVRAGARDVLEKPLQQPTLLPALERQLAAVGIPARSERDFNRWLGGRVRAARREAGQTLSDLARMSELSAAQVSQIELGKTATSTWTLARICGALKIPVASLFDRQ